MNSAHNTRTQCGQQNQPSPDRVAAFFDGIFERQYYTESGPLVRQLEGALADLFGTMHVVCVSNPSVAWIMLLEAASIRGPLLIPANAPRPVIEAVSWTRHASRLCDISPENGYRLRLQDLAGVQPEAPGGLIALNPWGGMCDIVGLETFAESKGIGVYIDSSEALGCRNGEVIAGARGHAEVFSFDARNLINGASGACIATQDESLADRLRCMRGSGGIKRAVAVNKTVNGRMSEAQAAYGLMGLECLDEWIARNRGQHQLYAEAISDLPEIQLLSCQGVTCSNYQQAVVACDHPARRAKLAALLRAQGYYCAELTYGTQQASPGMRSLEGAALALPLGSGVTTRAIQEICRSIIAAVRGAS